MIIFLSYLFYFVAATASPLQRRWLATQDRGEGQIAFAFRVALIVGILALPLPLFEPLAWEGSPRLIAFLAVLCAIFGTGYFASMYSAQKHVEAGTAALIGNVYTPVTIFTGTFLLHEELWPLPRVVGAILLFAAIFFVSATHRTDRFRFDKYFMLMVLSGVLLGLLLAAERVLIKTTGFSTGTLLSWWSQVFGLALVVLMTRAKTTYSLHDTFITGGLRFLQSLSWVVLVVAVGNLSIVSAVATFKVVIMFIAGAIFLHERSDMKRKIIGSLIAVAGLLLMK